ncbi:MAG: GntR family transcriptional regulator [Lachnospiraceae bacterium]
MISVDYKDRTPIYEQIIASIEQLIALGVLRQDEKLPSVRSLAIELSINPNTIQKAYTVLETKHVIYTVKGIGNFVSKNDDDIKRKKLEEVFHRIEHEVVEAKTYGLDKTMLHAWTTKLGEVLDD